MTSDFALDDRREVQDIGQVIAGLVALSEVSSEPTTAYLQSQLTQLRAVRDEMRRKRDAEMEEQERLFLTAMEQCKDRKK